MLPKRNPLSILLALPALLLTLTLLRFPAAGAVRALPLVVALAGYMAAGWWFLPRLAQSERAIITRFGLLIGLVFGGEILLEYALLPADNTPYGLVEYGLVFFLLLLAGMVSGWLGRSVRRGARAGLGSAMLGSVLWLVVLLTVFHLFYGSLRQAAVFRAEGNLEDFAHSGMTDFTAFVVQDFYGAGFFHLLLGMLFGALLGTLGGILGWLTAGWKQKITHQAAPGG